MTAVNTSNNNSVDSKYPARIARYIGVKEDTIYDWMKLGVKVKSHLNKKTGVNYIIYLDSNTI